ncbi:NAD(P)H-dependent oxidoreductase subunit E [Sphingomonas sp. GB1N7]|uniref:NAD(P)H-dependent oxidoreductase subunit E n=1 Tax=Parasphingomonas caseinilytica TaxID=3096158 RepID=UPI002FC8F60D
METTTLRSPAAAGTVGRGDYAEAVARLTPSAGNQRGALLPLLHALQEEFGFIDDALVPLVANALNLSRADVHGVITFYHDFRREPAGRHVIKLCRAESCQSRGGVAVERAAEEVFGIAMGKTSGDGRVTIEAVYCLGLCATGPNALFDGVPVSRVDRARLETMLLQVMP